MEQLWERALGSLQTHLSPENFETWIRPVQFGGVETDSIVLRIPNQFFADWISTHYLDLIFDTLDQEANGSTVPKRVRWELDETLREKAQAAREVSSPPPRRAETRAPSISADLNPKYRFKNFVVGPANQLAHAASVAVGSDPGRRYNPLFIYGGVGLGKTHLVNAIGHTVLQRNPRARILYVSAERFTNEFIWSLQNHEISAFRDRYRSHCDVLLMDDIQFLAGREQTQEEFFHTFNALYHSDRQIVVTSDVYPQQISEMQERLVSRFQSGMVADVQAPELDTRIAILQQKAESESIVLHSEVALFIAQTVRSNIRELEGTLLRIAVKAELLGQPIGLELAKEAMRAVIPNHDTATSVEDIQRIACGYFGIRLVDLKSRRRHRAVSFPRMVAMYVCRQRLGTSYPELGERFGGKDHTTVISAVRKIGGLVEAQDEQVLSAVGAIERKLGL
ncbi:MAG: chromosomal replication initiator protein DnaA [Polyangiales bacterium]